VGEHPNAALMRRLFDAFGRRDGASVAAIFDHEIAWRVGGRTTMSGEYRGWREVVAFLRRTSVETDGTYRSELRWALGDDGRAVALYRARGARNGRTIDIDQVLLCEVREGRLSDVTAVPLDAAAFEAFWA
jgi:ketosteroid isomerase-like protein